MKCLCTEIIMTKQSQVLRTSTWHWRQSLHLNPVWCITEKPDIKQILENFWQQLPHFLALTKSLSAENNTATSNVHQSLISKSFINHVTQHWKVSIFALDVPVLEWHSLDDEVQWSCECWKCFFPLTYHCGRSLKTSTSEICVQHFRIVNTESVVPDNRNTEYIKKNLSAMVADDLIFLLPRANVYPAFGRWQALISFPAYKEHQEPLKLFFFFFFEGHTFDIFFDYHINTSLNGFNTNWII